MIGDTPITTIPRITDAPPIMHSRKPTSKRHLKNTPRIHQLQTRNNTPGAVPLITKIEEHANQHVTYEHDPLDPILAALMTQPPSIPFTCNARHNLVTTQAINALTAREQCTPHSAFMHQLLRPRPSTLTPNLKHYANPMVHPFTGDVISSYKKAIC